MLSLLYSRFPFFASLGERFPPPFPRCRDLLEYPIVYTLVTRSYPLKALVLSSSSSCFGSLISVSLLWLSGAFFFCLFR